MTTRKQWLTAIEGARENLVTEYAAHGLDITVDVRIAGKGLFHGIAVEGIHTRSLRTLPEVHAYLEAMRRGAQAIRWAIMAKQDREQAGIDRAIRQDRARERSRSVHMTN